MKCGVNPVVNTDTNENTNTNTYKIRCAHVKVEDATLYDCCRCYSTLKYHWSDPDDLVIKPGREKELPALEKRRELTSFRLGLYCRRNYDGTRHLALPGNHLQYTFGLDDDDIPIISEFLREHKEVVSLELAYNTLSGPAIADMMDELAYACGDMTNSKLYYLGLMNCGLGESDLAMISESIGYTNITCLRINDNDFGLKRLAQHMKISLYLQDKLPRGRSERDEEWDNTLVQARREPTYPELYISDVQPGLNGRSGVDCLYLRLTIRAGQPLLDRPLTKSNASLMKLIESTVGRLKFLDLGNTGGSWGLLGTMAGALTIPGVVLEVLDVSRIIRHSPISLDHSPCAAEQIQMIIENCPTLKELHARHNWLDGHDVECIARAVANSNLLFLDLAGNHVGDKGAEVFAELLRLRPPLLGLNLSVNDIGEIGARTLGHALPYSRLRLLDVSLNRMCHGGLRLLIHTLKKCVPMRVLSVAGNQFDHDTCLVIKRMLLSGVLQQDALDVQIYDSGDGVLQAGSGSNTAHMHRQRYYLVRIPKTPLSFPPQERPQRYKLDFVHIRRFPRGYQPVDEDQEEEDNGDKPPCLCFPSRLKKTVPEMEEKHKHDFVCKQKHRKEHEKKHGDIHVTCHKDAILEDIDSECQSHSDDSSAGFSNYVGGDESHVPKINKEKRKSTNISDDVIWNSIVKNISDFEHSVESERELVTEQQEDSVSICKGCPCGRVHNKYIPYKCRMAVSMKCLKKCFDHKISCIERRKNWHSIQK